MRVLLILLTVLTVRTVDLFAAEVRMPQLDPRYWPSQAFWLIVVFVTLYLLVSKSFLPRIKKNLDERENKIKDDLEDAKNLKDNAEKKQIEYSETIVEAKKEVLKIILDSKKKLEKDISNKKKIIEKDIDKEIEKAQKEIVGFKQNSLDDIKNISEQITSKIIEEITGDKLNESSIKATIEETSKTNLSKYL